MSVPQHLSAFDGRAEDYIWFPNEEMPAAVPAPTPQTVPTGPITAEGLSARMRVYVETLLAHPNWQAELAEKNKAPKLAKRKARDAKREAMLRARLAA